MFNRRSLTAGCSLAVLMGGLVLLGRCGEDEGKKSRQAEPPHDAVADAQTPREVPAERPEQKKTRHDRSDVFMATKARLVNPALEDQPQEGKVTGFEFFRDP